MLRFPLDITKKAKKAKLKALKKDFYIINSDYKLMVTYFLVLGSM